MKIFGKEGESYGDGKFTLNTKVLEVDKFGIGHTIKAYCKEISPLLLVVGDSLKKEPLRNYLAECDNHCPVLFVKSEFSLSQDRKIDTRYQHIASGVARNPYSDNAFNFMLKHINIAKSSQLVVVHVVTTKDDKPGGREYLSSFKPLCKGKPYAIRSALVYARKEKTIPGGLATFCRDRKVELMVVGPKPQGGKKARAGGRITALCMDFIECDLLVYKDERTMEGQKESGFVPPKLGTIGPRLSSKYLVVSDSEAADEESEEFG